MHMSPRGDGSFVPCILMFLVRALRRRSKKKKKEVQKMGESGIVGISPGFACPCAIALSLATCRVTGCTAQDFREPGNV